MKKTLKIVLLVAIALLVLLVVGFLIYSSDYYHADDTVTQIMQSEADILIKDNLLIFSPTTPSDTALIFYPGAKVEYTAYLPMMKMLTQESITTIIIKMPFNFAIFDKNAADKVFDTLPHIKNWFIGGHSMGGAMASSYTGGNKEKVKGLILLGAYIYGDVSPENALTIYGTLNSNLEKNINYTENVIIIEGGNHAQFGNYGEQKGDLPATISSQEQQTISVEAILEFIEKKLEE